MRDDERKTPDGAEQPAGGAKGDPQPASEALPDGQFDDQRMPTTDGEPAGPDTPEAQD